MKSLFSFRYQSERFLRGHWECPSKDFSSQTVILASYPKSGNTWFRFVVSNIASLSNNDVPVNFETIEHYAPAIRGNRNLDNAKFVNSVPMFLKTHAAYTRCFSKYKSVIIIRDPFKAVPSYRDYLIKAREKPMPELEVFCHHWRYGLQAWAQFISSWEKHSYVIVKYEDLLQAPVETVKDVYAKLGFALEDDIVERALELSERKKMRQALESQGDPNNHNSFRFVRDANENPGMRFLYTDSQLKNKFPFFYQKAKEYGYI